MEQIPDRPLRDAASQQLTLYAEENEGKERPIITSTTGNPHPYKDATLTVGYRGPALLQDWYLIDELAHFSRERIPERVVHAKGSGAFGYFEPLHDLSLYTSAVPFTHLGQKTPIVVRFSQVAGEMGSSDTVRDIRGFAIKFYTEDGVWDLVGNNTPIFFVRDSGLFPSFIHALKRNPVTHLRDWDAFWDFLSLRPESVHMTLMFFSDRGIPASYRQMHGYGSNTFAFLSSTGTFTYCKFHYRTDQSIANLTPARAQFLAGQDADYYARDLYNAIASGKYPAWTLYVQIMTQEQAMKTPYDPFDVTKVWLHADYPLIPVGRLVLNRNPANYFAEIEQLAFDPAHLIPGIEPSPDRMLQGRLFNYGDTHRHRLGPNSHQLPVNQGTVHVTNFSRDGYGTFDGQGGAPNYHPNSFNGPIQSTAYTSPVLPILGNAARYDNGNADNYTQARLFYRDVLDEGARDRLIGNLAVCLAYANQTIQNRVLDNFLHIDSDFVIRLRAKMVPPLSGTSSTL